MPNTEARILRSIWDDQDWLDLPMDAKTFYFTVLSGHGMNHAGIVPIPRREWINLFPDEDAGERLTVARKILEERRFVYVDENTDEVLVRSYIRRDVADGPPGTFRSAMDAVCQVRSPRLRDVLRGELERLDVAKIESKKPESKLRESPIDAYRRALAAVRQEPNERPRQGTAAPPDAMGDSNGNGKGHSKAPSNGHASNGASDAIAMASNNAISHSNGHAMPHRSGDGDGDGVRTTSVGGWVGNTRASAREKPPTPPRTLSDRVARLYADPDNDAPCRQHPDDDRACHRCRDIRVKRPDGYDPRPPELIPDDQLDVDAWADPRTTIAAPVEIEEGDPAERRRWYRDAGEQQRADRRAQARERLAAAQARYPA